MDSCDESAELNKSELPTAGRQLSLTHSVAIVSSQHFLQSVLSKQWESTFLSKVGLLTRAKLDGPIYIGFHFRSRGSFSYVCVEDQTVAGYHQFW